MANSQSTKPSRIDYGMSPHDHGWLAGLFDGEGCVTIAKTRKPKGGFAYHLRVILKMTHRPTLERVGALLGIDSFLTQKLSHVGRSTAYRLTWTGTRAAEVLEFLLPHLVTKKLEADLGIEFVNCRSFANHATENGAVVCEMVYLKMKNLKSRNYCPSTYHKEHHTDEVRLIGRVKEILNSRQEPDKATEV